MYFLGRKCVGNILFEGKCQSPSKYSSSQVSRKAPVPVRNLVRQVTVHLVGEEETTEQKIDQNILLFLIYVIIIILVALISLFVAIFTAPLFLNGWINIDPNGCKLHCITTKLMAVCARGAQVTIYVNLSTQTRFCIGISQVFVPCTLASCQIFGTGWKVCHK